MGYTNDAEFYDRDAGKYRDFLDELEFLPDYPVPPGFAAVVLAVFALMGAWIYRRRKAA